MRKTALVSVVVLVGLSAWGRDYQETSVSLHHVDFSLTLPMIDFVPGMPSHITMEIRIHYFAERLPKLNGLSWYVTDIGGGPWIIYGACTTFSLDDPEYDAATDTWTKVIQQDVFIYWYVPECSETQLYGFAILYLGGYGYRIQTEFMTVTFVTDVTPPQTLIAAPEPGICDPDVTFEFAALDDYSKNEDFRYYCKLEPIETEYKYQGYSYSKSYSDLEPGDYIFYVYAKDLAHNTDPSPATLAVTVEIPDTTPPTVLMTSPFDGETDANPDTDIIIAFSEAMDKPMTESAFSINPPVPDGFMWNSKLIYVPSAMLMEKTEYTTTISTQACDLAGNPFEEPYVFSFYIGDYTPPEDVASLAAEPGESFVELSWANPSDDFAGVVIFRKMDLEPEYMPIRGASYVFGESYDGCVCIYSDTGEECLDEALLAETTYYYKVFSFDLSRNYSSGVVDSATTLIAEPPVVVSTCPEDGCSYVSRSVEISIEFSEPMDVTSTEAAFSITPVVEGDYSWIGENTLVFSPQHKLSPNTDYTAIISTEAMSEAGICLDEAYSFSFSTRQSEGLGQNVRQIVDDYASSHGCGVGVSIVFAMLALIGKRKSAHA